MTKTGYVNGSDLLFSYAGKAFGHCTSHTTTYTAQTKERAVKPIASAGSSAGFWKDKTVVSLSVSVKADGLRCYDETENGMKAGLAAWVQGRTVEVKGFERGQDAQPYMSGNFVVTNIEETAPAGDDATYSISLESSGEVTINPSKLTGEAISE